MCVVVVCCVVWCLAGVFWARARPHARWDYTTPAHSSWWLRGDTPGSTPAVGVLDWRNKHAADYFVNTVIGEATATDPNIDGVFVDSGFGVAASNPNMTYASRCAVLGELTRLGTA